MIQRVLGNGFTVVVAVDHKAPVAISNLWFAVGSNHEWEGVHGWAHGIEHMMFKGTPRLAPGDISRRVKQAGGTLNAGTGHETTNYHILLPSRNLDVAIDIHADIVQHALFDPGELDREREVLVEENRMRSDRHTGGGHTYDDLLELAFRAAPYRRPLGGTDESLRRTPREEILRFRDTWYVPANAALIIAGDVEPDRVLAAVEAAYGDWGGGTPPARAPLEEPEQREFRYRSSCGDVGKIYLKMGWHVPGELHADAPALKVLQEIAGNGRSSRLFREVREKRGLVSDLMVFEETGRDLGFLVIDAVTDAASLAGAQAAILAELDRLAAEPPGRAEVERAIVAIERDFAAGNETVEGRAAHLGWFWTVGDMGAADDYVERIRGVTAEAVTDAAGRYLGVDRCSMNVFHPRAAEVIAGRDRDAVYEALRAANGTRRGGRAVPAAAAAPAPRRMPAISPGAARDVLPAGFTLVTRRIARAPLVAIGAFVRAGSVRETAAQNGVTMLAQRVMIKGTARRNAEAVAAGIESLGGIIGPSASSDTAGLFVSVLRRNAGAAWEILAEILTSPSFDGEEIERERRLLLEEIDAVNDNSMRSTLLEFGRAVFGSHPYGLPPIGTRESVSALERDDLTGWYRRAWTPENVVISVVGDIDPAEMRGRAAELTGLPAGARAAEPPPAPAALDGRRERLLARDVNQEVIVLGFPGPAALSPDRYAMEVLQAVLSGMGNRFFVSLRDRKSLCYFTGFMYRPMRGAGLLAAYIGTSPDKEEAAIDGLMAELRDARDHAPTAEEIERAKNTIVGNFALAQQTAAELASLHAGAELLGLGIDWPERYPERILGVTRDDLVAAARRWIDLEHYALVVTRPAAAGTKGGAAS